MLFFEVNAYQLTRYVLMLHSLCYGVRNLIDLQEKGLQSYFDTDRANNPFISVTSDNYLNY